MPILTGSKAWSVQPPDHLVSPGEDLTNFHRRFNGPQQDKAIVIDSPEIESKSISEATANRVHDVTGFRVFK